MTSPAPAPAQVVPRLARLARRSWLLALVAATLRGPTAAAQVQLSGQTFAARARVDGQELVLNGVGLRAVAWLEGYAAGLYLPRRAQRADEVLAMPGAKRLQLRMLQDVPASEFVKAFGKGVVRNTPVAEVDALRERMARFDQQVHSLAKVRKGDVVDLDYLPSAGLAFTHNGRRIGAPIAGPDFYAALLRIFIGDRPVDAELKTGLLGR
jgi:hypothetical protein